ncbi:MAG: hypothetical protein HOV94_44350 [Saccharothrix sp.]|nr:hypothetical protein [Saccharothrix sp.]
MSRLRGLRNALITTTFAGAVMTATSLPAYAYWIYHYDGAYSTVEECGQARQTVIQDHTDAGQMFDVDPCAYRDRNPETNSGPAGWYYRWGIFAD